MPIQLDIYLKILLAYLQCMYIVIRGSVVVRSMASVQAAGVRSPLPPLLGGDAEHVSLKSQTCSIIPGCKIGTSKT